jgi:hypothetical protein
MLKRLEEGLASLGIQRGRECHQEWLRMPPSTVAVVSLAPGFCVTLRGGAGGVDQIPDTPQRTTHQGVYQ